MTASVHVPRRIQLSNMPVCEPPFQGFGPRRNKSGDAFQSVILYRSVCVSNEKHLD